MLRLLALVLLLANGVYFAWSTELLRAYGFGPAQQNEPQRLAQQISPEAVSLLSPKALQEIEAQIKADQAPKECLQAGPFDAAQSAALRLALADALPADTWGLEEQTLPARWIVYLGKFASAELLAKKRAEIAAMNLPTEGLTNPELEPGISLAGFAAKAEADAALARLNARGLRTARVVQERADSTAYLLKLPAVGPTLKSKLGALGAVLADKPLQACTP
jgi:hypothetical protein